MATSTTRTNKPILPRGNDQSPKGYNRAALYSGKALDFDGVNDNIQVSAFSTTGSTRSLSYFFKASASGNKRVFEIRSGSIFFNSTIFDGKINTFDGVNGINTTKTFNDNKWHHVVITHNGNNNAAIYVDGVSQELDASTFSVHDITNQTLYIGGLSGVYYDGGLSNLRLFNVALTAAQVSDLYNNPEKIVPTGVEDTALKLWLPMMEGAGTTAYDGSGNGNHGTISGATYVHGVGAPVAQSAVIDWNKGTNLLAYSQELNQSSKWFVSNSSVTANNTTAPDGTETADKVTYTATANGTINQQVDSLDISSNYTTSVWIKGDANYTMKFGFYSPSQLVDINITTEWQRFEYTATPSGTTRYPQITNDAGGVKTIYVWGWQLEKVSSAEAYIPNHTNTAITTPVLLPQGLTSGRDITGVNLFENVRKQGALNLDGNSWAEVHDNASLDISPSMTMEAWINCDDISTTSYETIFAKPSGTTWVYPYAHYDLRVISTNVQWWFEGTFYIATYNVSLSGWNHLLVTKDGASEILYINGVQVATHTGNVAISASPYDLILGANTDKDEKVSAQLAQPRIYNRALTAEEVQRNYNAGKNIYK